MENYDNYLLQDNPIDGETQFDSTDLYDCFEHMEKTGDIEPLRTAISINADRIRRVRTLLKANTENGIATICLKILK